MLRDIRQAIGPILRIDTHTTSKTIGRFARICVQVNLENPLIKLIRIGGIEQPVQYEGINALCFSCGRVGHKVDGCPYMARATCKDGKGKVVEESSAVNEEKASGQKGIKRPSPSSPIRCISIAKGKGVKPFWKPTKPQA